MADSRARDLKGLMSTVTPAAAALSRVSDGFDTS
jgi:hypothetical protein